MNKRIRELLDQAAGHAGAFPSGQNNSLETHVDFMDKFAELIVKECIQGLKERIATRYQGSDKDRDIGYGMEIVYFDIVDKFGIQE